MYAIGTGGGPQKVTEPEDADHRIQQILGKRLSGLTSEFDGDAPGKLKRYLLLYLLLFVSIVIL